MVMVPFSEMTRTPARELNGRKMIVIPGNLRHRTSFVSCKAQSLYLHHMKHAESRLARVLVDENDENGDLSHADEPHLKVNEHLLSAAQLVNLALSIPRQSRVEQAMMNKNREEWQQTKNGQSEEPQSTLALGLPGDPSIVP